MIYEVTEITPELAELYLSKNTKNRQVKLSHVNNLASQMSLGIWVQNGESIKFDDYGNLIDGQHRLNACIKSGVNFKSLVIRGLPSESFKTIDTGSKRTAQDLLSVDNIKNSCAVSAIIKFVISYNKTKALSAVSNVPVSNQEILDEYNKSKDDYDFLSAYAVKVNRILNTQFFGMAKIMFDAGHREWFEPAMEKIKTGQNLNYGDPCLAMREWAIGSTANNRSYKNIAYIKFINALVHKKELKVIRVNYETYPQLVF